MRVEYDDLFQDVEINEKIGRGSFYSDTYRREIAQNRSLKRRILKTLLNRISMTRLYFAPKRRNVLIWGAKFTRIINEEKDFFNFIAVSNSVNEMRKLKQSRGIYPFFTFHWQSLIDDSFLTHDMNSAQKATEKISCFLKKNRICLILLGNDKLFIERAIKTAGETLHVPVVIIQHGIYNIDSFKKLKTADSANTFWVWSDYVKDLYNKYIRRIDVNVRVIGYPLEHPSLKKCDDKNVLFLGNQYFKFNQEEGEGYLQIAKTVKEICKKNGWRFKYRPHPSEIIDDRYKGFTVSKGIPLLQDIEQSKIVVGDVSSSMIEAAMYGRPVVQIIWSDRSKIGTCDPMYSFTLKCSDKSDDIAKTIAQALSLENQDTFIDEYYMYIDNDFDKSIRMEMLNIMSS